jgi:hypothetical protein
VIKLEDKEKNKEIDSKEENIEQETELEESTEIKKESENNKEENENKEKQEESQKSENNEDTKEEEVESNDKMLFYGIGALILIIALFFLIPKIIPDNSVLTLDELHSLNFQGKLSEEKGYLYNNVYSFVKYDELWYTQLKAPEGDTVYNVPFHFSPKDVEHIKPQGMLNHSTLDRYPAFYMTFDPEDDNLNYIAASTGETVRIFIEAFGKKVIGSCARNATKACATRPIINCSSTSAPVFYFASEEQTNLLYLDNCVIISGNKEELFKATDRMLFDLMGII